MPSGSLGTALENLFECLRKGFEKPLEGLWDAFGGPWEALGRLWRPWGRLGRSLGGSWKFESRPLGSLGKSWGTLWDAFGALEDLQELRKVRFSERCHVDMRSKQILTRFYHEI